MSEPKSKRGRLLVLSQFQRWFLKVFVSYAAIFLGIFGVGLFLWFRVLLNELMNLAGLLSETFITVIRKHMLIGLGVTVIFIIVLCVMAALQALFFSRRIAGPIFSLVKHLEKCEKKGRLEPWQIRRGDLFVDLVDRFNSVVEKVNEEKKGR
jgi:methyl-accepting chemotaxis protein